MPSITTALAAIDNAMRTVLAMAGDGRQASRTEGSRITTRVIAGTAMTTLDPPIPFAYAVDHARQRVVLSTSPAAVARSSSTQPAPQPIQVSAGSGPRRSPTPSTYACVDFDVLERLVARHRDRVVQSLAARQKRSADEVDRDLSQALALAQLFRAGFITSRFEKDATAVYRSVGLMRHEHGGK